MYESLLEHQFIIEFSPHIVASSIIIFSALLMFVSAAFVRKIWVAATLPVALFIVAGIIFTIHNISGQPTERVFRGEFQYLGHSISDDMTWIYMWGEEEGIGHPITSKVPYTKDLHEELAKAKEAADEGRQMAGEIISTGEEGMPGEYAFHEFLMHDTNSLKTPPQ